MGKLVIRAATIADLDFILPELKQFSEFYGTKKHLFPDDAAAFLAMSDMISNHLTFIAEDEHEKYGFISGYVSKHPYNSEITVLTETFWWVKESKRNSRAGLMLFNQFTDFGKKYCDWVIMTLEHKSPVNEASITKRGFAPIERTYLMEIQNG